MENIFKESLKESGKTYIIPESEPIVYCFQCEIDMPTKYKDGKLYCKQCGLRHDLKYD